MTYARLLLLFIVAPILVSTFLLLRDRHRKHVFPQTLQGWPAHVVLVALIIIAIIYTTPWDNHLIATRVWWYNSALVTGITLDWIPLEEFMFFPLQTMLVGLWFCLLAPRIAIAANPGARAMRIIATSVAGGVWLISLFALFSGWRPGTYLGWELAWALPPLIIQLALGADIIWQHRWLIVAAILPAVLYLCAVDTLAIHEGIWTIDPHQSLGILIGGQLPLEECIFFLLTTTLIVTGCVMGLAPESRRRIHAWYAARSLAPRTKH